MTTPRFELTSQRQKFRGYQLNHRGDRKLQNLFLVTTGNTRSPPPPKPGLRHECERVFPAGIGPYVHPQKMRPTYCLRDSAGRLRCGSSRASIWFPSAGGGTREAVGAVVAREKPGRSQQHAQAYHGRGKLDHRRAREVLNPCARK